MDTQPCLFRQGATRFFLIRLRLGWNGDFRHRFSIIGELECNRDTMWAIAIATYFFRLLDPLLEGLFGFLKELFETGWSPRFAVHRHFQIRAIAERVWPHNIEPQRG